MDCVNCGHENPKKALICYWCARDPITGAQPYGETSMSLANMWDELVVPEVALPQPIDVPAPMPVPDMDVMLADPDSFGMTMPEFPSIVVPELHRIPDQEHFTVVRRRARHRPSVRAAPSGPLTTRPLLPGLGRLLVFVGGLGVLVFMGFALLAAVGVASFGTAFCLFGFLALSGALWLALLMARTGKRFIDATGQVYERLEVFGRTLREVAPGVLQVIPVNLPNRMGLLDQPVAYSELRALDSGDGAQPNEEAEDLLTGAIASLVARDDVVLSRRTYPVEVRGQLVRPSKSRVTEPVLTRRRAYVGPGELEERIARILRTDRPMTVEELMEQLVGTGGSKRAQQVIAAVRQALSEHPPDLEALSSPDTALAEFEKYRKAIRKADPELYALLEGQIQRGLGAVLERSIPSSLLDRARYASTSGRGTQPSRNE